MELIKYRIGNELHSFTVVGDELVHAVTGEVVCKVDKAEKHPCGCKLLTPRVAGVAALNRLVSQYTTNELNKILG